MKCELYANVIQTEKGHAITYRRCVTHDYVLNDAAMTCPIGRMEAAMDEKLALITGKLDEALTKVETMRQDIGRLKP